MTVPLVTLTSRIIKEPARLKAAGNVGVVRYLTHNDPQAFTPNEALLIAQADLQVGLAMVPFERAAISGYDQGVADGAYARDASRKFLRPSSAPVYCQLGANVSPAEMPMTLSYLIGWRQAMGDDAIGVCGGASVIRAVRDGGMATHLWQLDTSAAVPLQPGVCLDLVESSMTLSDGITWTSVAIKPDWGGWTYSPTGPLNLGGTVTTPTAAQPDQSGPLVDIIRGQVEAMAQMSSTILRGPEQGQPVPLVIELRTLSAAVHQMLERLSPATGPAKQPAEASPDVPPQTA